MFVNDCLNINEKGHLTIGGCDTVELAKEYGTPLYVLDENTIRTTCRSYVESFKKFYNGNGMPLYASKALSCKELCRIANEEHLGLDVVSGGEIYTAQQAGFPMEKTHFHGNNKTAAEIEFALNAGVGTFVVDNLYELELLNEIAGKLGKRQRFHSESSLVLTLTHITLSEQVRLTQSSALHLKQARLLRLLKRHLNMKM